MSATEAADSRPQLVCPVDEQPLAHSGRFLSCPEGHRWTVRKDIPRMVAQDDTYTAAFGLQWNTFRKTQLDSYTGTTITHDRLRRCIGEEGWQQLNRPPLCDVLEAGCGAGRFSEVLLNTSHARVTSLDQSEAVEANVSNFPESERHRVVQADICSAPFPPEQFDFVICLGVVQHTAAPEQTMEHLYRQVRPGGLLVIDHYTNDTSSWLGRATSSSTVVRPVLKRLPPKLSYRCVERLVRTFFPMHRAVQDSRLGRRLLSRVSPVLTYFDVHPELDDNVQFEWALLDTYDSLTDYYKHKRSIQQIEDHLGALGATDIQCWHDGNGVEARCRKPAA